MSYYCVPFLLGKPRVQNTFFKSFSHKNARIDRIVNLKNSNLDLIQRIHSRCGFDGFMIRFCICLRNAPSVKLLARYVIEDVYKTWTPDTPLDLNHGPLGEPGPSTTHVDDPKFFKINFYLAFTLFHKLTKKNPLSSHHDLILRY